MTTKKKRKKKTEKPRPNRSPYHPFMLDLSGMNEKDADEIERGLREKGL